MTLRVKRGLRTGVSPDGCIGSPHRLYSQPDRSEPPMTEAPIKGPASYFPSIEKKYGRPVAEWKAEIRAGYPAKHMELVAMLKNEHDMGHGHANALVAHTLAEDGLK
jgi:hypothetical protein